MNELEMSGWFALLGAVVVGRIMNERGFRELNAEEKIRLMDGFSATRAYSLIPLVALMAGYWVLAKYSEVDRFWLSIGYFSLLILYVVARAYLNRRKLLQLQMPDRYRRVFTIVQAISFIGIAWFFFALIYSNRL